jgi:hypothetical protein
MSYYAASAEKIIGALNRLFTVVTTTASLVIIVRLTGRSEIAVSDVVTVNVNWLVLALPAVTLIHWWLAGQAASCLAQIQAAELKGAPAAASGLLDRIPGLGWYTSGSIPRKVAPSGRIVFRWADPSIHVAVLSLILGIAASMPWQLQSGDLSLTAPLAVSLGILGFAIVAGGLNWRIGSIWVSRVAELQLKPADRHLSTGGEDFYDFYGPSDSFPALHGVLVFSGALLMYVGYSVLGGVLVGSVASDWALGVLVSLAMMCGPFIAMKM